MGDHCSIPFGRRASRSRRQILLAGVAAVKGASLALEGDQREALSRIISLQGSVAAGGCNRPERGAGNPKHRSHKRPAACREGATSPLHRMADHASD
jgi:hypothetical protein